jgi:hypothetical protein
VGASGLPRGQRVPGINQMHMTICSYAQKERISLSISSCTSIGGNAVNSPFGHSWYAHHACSLAVLSRRRRQAAMRVCMEFDHCACPQKYDQRVTRTLHLLLLIMAL